MDTQDLNSDISTSVCCTENTSNSLNTSCGVVGGCCSSHYEHNVVPSSSVFNVPSTHQYNNCKANNYRQVTSPFKCHNSKSNFNHNYCNNSACYNSYNDNNNRHRQPKHCRFNKNAVFRRNNSPHVLSKIVFHSKNDPLQKGESVCDKSNVSKRHFHYNKRNNKFDVNHQNNNNNFVKFNRTNSVSMNDDEGQTKKKKTRRSRRRKRTYQESSNDQQTCRKRMRWTECNANEVSRLHRNCVQNGQPLAPYNTTQFIMNEHNAEKEIDFDELSGQIQQMHNNRQRVAPNCNTSDCDDSVKEDYYSSPEDESFFLEQQFHEAYDTMHAERLNSMSKSDLLKEYLMIEKELELMKQKRSELPNDIKEVSQQLEDKSSSDICKSCVTNRSIVQDNKNLIKLLKQLYSRYNSLIYCIGYVNTNSDNSSENMIKSYSLTSDLHYRISKYICHQESPIQLSCSSESTSTSSYNSSSASISSEDDKTTSCNNDVNGDVFNQKPNDADLPIIVHTLVSQLVARVAQGNS